MSERGRTKGAQAPEGGGESAAGAWDLLAGHYVPELVVAIIEAFHWVREPLSPAQVSLLLGGQKYTYGRIAYYFAELRKLGVLEVVKTRQVRGATEAFHVLIDESYVRLFG